MRLEEMEGRGGPDIRAAQVHRHCLYHAQERAEYNAAWSAVELL